MWSVYSLNGAWLFNISEVQLYTEYALTLFSPSFRRRSWIVERCRDADRALWSREARSGCTTKWVIVLSVPLKCHLCCSFETCIYDLKMKLWVRPLWFRRFGLKSNVNWFASWLAAFTLVDQRGTFECLCPPLYFPSCDMWTESVSIKYKNWLFIYQAITMKMYIFV